MAQKIRKSISKAAANWVAGHYANKSEEWFRGDSVYDGDCEGSLLYEVQG